MHLSEINIYPVKSLAGIALDSAVVEERGLQFDRRWMLVDENRQFITQREVPWMALVDVEVDRNGMTLSAPQCETLYIPTKQDWGKQRTVKVWSSSVSALVYPELINEWF